MNFNHKIKQKINDKLTSTKLVWEKNLIFISRSLSKPLNKPTSIMFNLTPNCVLRCKQCDIWKNPPESHLSLADSQVIIDKLRNWLGNTYIFFTGGEPLMNTDLPLIIGYAYQKGILSHLNSNAVLINEGLAQKLCHNHLFAVSISLDGATAKTHDYLRGRPGTFDKAVKAISFFQKQGKNCPSIYLNTVVMKDNVHELEQLILLAREKQTNGISFQCLLPNLGPHNTTISPDNNPLWPKFTAVSKALRRITKMALREPLILTRPDQLSSAISFYKNPHYLDSQTCAAGINNFIIDHLGDVRLCFGFPPIGNILKDDPSKIWWSEEAQRQRVQIRNCKQSCKIIVCNQTDTRRNQTAISKFSE